MFQTLAASSSTSPESTGPVLPQEILDIIIGLVEDRPTLKACNLSGRSLRSVAQRALFRDACLNWSSLRRNEHLRPNVIWRQRAHKLLECFRFTEVNKHVRCLKLSSNYGQHYAKDRETLFELVFLLATWTDGTSSLWLSDVFWSMPRPSMIHTLRLEVFRLRQADALRIIMSFPRLTCLYWDAKYADFTETEDDSTRLLWPHITPPKLHHLHITSFFGLPRFPEHAFPLDKDVYLRSLVMPARGPDSASWRSVVKRAGNRLEELEVGGPGRDFCMSPSLLSCCNANQKAGFISVGAGEIFDLTHNVRLRSLTFRLTEGDSLIWILGSLQALPSSLLQSLTFQQPSFGAPNVQILKDLDELLSDRSRFSELRTVKFVLPDSRRPNYAAKVFPKLVERDMLEFED